MAADHVTLSDRELEARAIREAIDQLPEVRDERIQRLRQLLEQGTYRIAGTQVTERLIHEILINRPPKTQS